MKQLGWHLNGDVRASRSSSKAETDQMTTSAPSSSAYLLARFNASPGFRDSPLYHRVKSRTCVEFAAPKADPIADCQSNGGKCREKNDVHARDFT